MEEQLRIGSGGAATIDRITPAIELSEEPTLDYLVFDGIAEMNIGIDRYAKDHGDSPGYNPLLEERMRGILPGCANNDITVVTNMGSAAPKAAAERVAEIGAELDIDSRVAAVFGSDVSDQFESFEGSPTFTDVDPATYEDDAVTANAYMGVEGILEALQSGADVVITDRVSDVAMYLAPMIHEFGWRHAQNEDRELIGQGIVAGHLMECAGQVTGGYFADPGYKDVDGLDELGFPILEVSADGDVVLTKLPNTGGRVTERTCKEQLLYEVHDPNAYVTPDGVADFTGVEFETLESDRIRVTGGDAGPRPEQLKVNISYYDGFLCSVVIGYAGPGALERAELAGKIARSRFDKIGIDYDDVRVDSVGVDSMHGAVGDSRTTSQPYEVRARVAAKTPTKEDADRLVREVRTLGLNGPAGGGGSMKSVRPVVGIVSTFLDRSAADQRVTLYEAENRLGDQQPPNVPGETEVSP